MSKHMKRLTIPRVWSLPKKESKWAVKVLPGPHPVERSIPLLVVARDYLHLCDNAREAKRIIAKKEFLVDGRVVTEPKFPLGLMDVLSIPKKKETYRMLLDPKGKLRLVRIPEENAGWKLVRIEGKTTVKGGKTQLNLHDGRNIILKKNDYRTGDVLKIEIPSQKTVEVYPLKEGSLAMVIGGDHSGQIAPISGYQVTKGSQQNLVHFKEGFMTVKNNVFVVGISKPEVTLPEASAV